jgi:hypothetical protein
MKFSESLKVKIGNIFRLVGYPALILILFVLVYQPRIGICADDEIWYVHDVIEPSVGRVRWFEEGTIAVAPVWIAEGAWYEASMRQSLVAENDIFVSTYELVDWSLSKPHVEELYGTKFGSFNDFANALQKTPSQWLDMSWEIDTGWYGVSSETTKIRTSYDEASDEAELWTWFHITHVPEYFASEGKLESWLTGFDLTPISIGSLERWEFYEDWSETGIKYELHFEAPANVLSQRAGNYTCILGVSSDYQGYTFKIQQTIDVKMPTDTEVKETNPSSMTVFNGDTATFAITRGDTYPATYTVVSGPLAKSLGQAFVESAAVWTVTPVGWAAIGSLLVLALTGFRGRAILKRNNTYHRLYKSMITLFDLYSQDLPRFHEEMDSVSKSVFKMVIEDRITDDQFEKLLRRRDDLLERAEGATDKNHEP